MRDAPFLSLPPGGATPDRVWWLRSTDGVRLRAALWRPEGAVAHAVLLNGRTEFIEKMAIPAADLIARGYAVVSLDWRGQGLSDRLAAPPLKGHVGDFAEFQRDLDTLLSDEEVTGLSGPRVLVAHSMGGAIGAAALTRPDLGPGFKAAIFSAPMFGIPMTGLTRTLAWATVRLSRLLGKAEAWPPFGDVKTPYVLSDPDENVLTGDRDVWGWMVSVARDHPELSIAMPTLGWFDASTREMERLRALQHLPCPALCLAGSVEAVVDPAAIAEVAAQTGSTHHVIEGGRHELLIEDAPLRRQAWAAIDAFLADQGLPHGSEG